MGDRIVLHVAARIIRGEPAFADDEIKEEYLHLVKRYFRAAGVTVIYFVLMTGHSHWMPRGELSAISAAFRDAHRDFAKLYNSQIGEKGHLFQGRFFRRPIEDDRDLLATSRYLAWNPTNARICATPAEYRWSADSAYRHGRCVFPVDTTLLLAVIGGADPRQSYARLVDPPPTGLARDAAPRDRLTELAVATGTTTRALIRSRDPELLSARQALVRQLRLEGHPVDSLAEALGIDRKTIIRLGRQTDDQGGRRR